LGALGPGPAGPLDKTALAINDYCPYNILLMFNTSVKDRQLPNCNMFTRLRRTGRKLNTTNLSRWRKAINNRLKRNKWLFY